MSDHVLDLKWDVEGTFKSRLNRFLGIVDIVNSRGKGLRTERVHIHDPGRLKEILYQGNRVLLKRVEGNQRSTKYDIIAGFCDDEWVLVHSGYHRRIAEWVIKNEEIGLFGKIRGIKAETKLGHSRIDFLLIKDDGREIWVEVKGCTLARGGIALFPDAPTKRGRKHIQALISAKERGADSAILILVFRPDAICFAPNSEADPEFSSVFRSAVDVGVEVHPTVFRYENGMVHYLGKIPLCERSSDR